MHDLVDLLNFSARKEVQIGIDHEAQSRVGVLPTMCAICTCDASLHACVKHHHLLGKLDCLLNLWQLNNDTASVPKERE